MSPEQENHTIATSTHKMMTFRTKFSLGQDLQRMQWKSKGDTHVSFVFTSGTFIKVPSIALCAASRKWQEVFERGNAVQLSRESKPIDNLEIPVPEEISVEIAVKILILVYHGEILHPVKCEADLEGALQWFDIDKKQIIKIRHPFWQKDFMEKQIQKFRELKIRYTKAEGDFLMGTDSIENPVPQNVRASLDIPTDIIQLYCVQCRMVFKRMGDIENHAGKSSCPTNAGLRLFTADPHRTFICTSCGNTFFKRPAKVSSRLPLAITSNSKVAIQASGASDNRNKGNASSDRICLHCRPNNCNQNKYASKCNVDGFRIESTTTSTSDKVGVLALSAPKRHRPATLAKRKTQVVQRAPVSIARNNHCLNQDLLQNDPNRSLIVAKNEQGDLHKDEILNLCNNSWFCDKTIDLCSSLLYNLLKPEHVLLVPTHVFGYIRAEKGFKVLKTTLDVLCNQKSEKTNVLASIANFGEHWILLVAKKESREILIGDTLRGCLSVERLEAGVRVFCEKVVTSVFGPADWEWSYYEGIVKQNDSYSCGPASLLLLEKVLAGRPVRCSNPEDYKQYRRKILRRALLTTEAGKEILKNKDDEIYKLLCP